MLNLPPGLPEGDGLLFDIETNGLYNEVDKLHVIVIYDFKLQRYERYDPISGDYLDGLMKLANADWLTGHNIVGYDIPVLKKLFPGWEPKGALYDTLLMAQLAFPTVNETDWGRVQKGILPRKLLGRHSLEAYGYRLGCKKGTFGQTTDWGAWSPEMSDYCEQDVTVNFKLFDVLMRPKYQKRWLPSISMETHFNTIITRQENRGFHFDVTAAQSLYAVIAAEKKELEQALRKEFPPFYKPKQKKVFVPKRDNKRLGYVEGAACTKIELVEFNPGSSMHVYKLLISKYGWVPYEFTKKSKVPDWLLHLFDEEPGAKVREPTIDDEVLSALDYPEAKQIARYLTLQKRCGQIAEGKQAWLKTYSPERQCIHGAVNTLGTVSGRCSHFSPNLAQVPNAHAEYGPECRDLFKPRPGFVLVGCDAAGLEARDLAHYLWKYDGGKLGNIILNGKKEDGTDIHTINANTLGCDRNTAKTFFYAFLYGGGDAKLGAILGGGKRHGKKMRAKFLKALPALKVLTERVQEAVKKRGYLRGIDGRMLHSRSPHSALNLLCQSAGALQMKKALLYCDEDLQAEGLIPGEDYEYVANVHDEFQIEVLPHLAEKVGKIAAESIHKAGMFFNWNCELKGEYDIGSSWKETH